MKIEYVKTEEVKPYAHNPRQNDRAVQIVEKSISEFGFQNPIILDKNNEIIAGHTRLRAAKNLNIKEVPTIRAEELTDEQVKAFRIMDNKSTEYAKWDLDLLKVEFEGMENLEFTGFTEAEIDKIMDPKEKLSIGNTEPKYEIQLGDVYQCGQHRIICGDSTKEETYLKLIPSGTNIQCIFTDPPYGVSYSGTNNPNGRSWEVIEGDDMRGDELYEMLYGCFKQLNQYLIKNGALYVFHANWNQMIFEKALNYAGFRVKQVLIWNKNHTLGRDHYHWCHEPMFYCSRLSENPDFFGTRCNKTTLNTIDPEKMNLEELKKFVTKIKKESTIWEIRKDNPKDYIHPTQKPTKLAQRAIVNSSKIGDSILDPFAGSFSTMMACEEKKRICYTIELDPTFCSHGIERWEKLTNKRAIKLK